VALCKEADFRNSGVRNSGFRFFSFSFFTFFLTSFYFLFLLGLVVHHNNSRLTNYHRVLQVLMVSYNIFRTIALGVILLGRVNANRARQGSYIAIRGTGGMLRDVTDSTQTVFRL